MSKRRATTERKKKSTQKAKRLRKNKVALHKTAKYDFNGTKDIIGDEFFDTKNVAVEHSLEISFRKKLLWISGIMQDIKTIIYVRNDRPFPDYIHVPDEICTAIFFHAEKIEEILKYKTICKKWYFIIMESTTSSVAIWSHYEKKYKNLSSFVSRLNFGTREKRERSEKRGQECSNRNERATEYDAIEHSLSPDKQSSPLLHFQLKSIIYRLRRYRRNSLEMCSECGVSRDTCSILCASCRPRASLAPLHPGYCRLSTRADEIEFPKILEDGIIKTHSSPAIVSSFIVRHCSACYNIVKDEDALHAHFRLNIISPHSTSSSFDLLVICPACVEFFRGRKKYHRRNDGVDLQVSRLLQEMVGNQCRDTILCDSCLQSSFSDFASMRPFDKLEDPVGYLDGCSGGIWMEEGAFDHLLSCGPDNVKVHREQILKACEHVAVFHPIDLTVDEAEMAPKTITINTRYLLKVYDPKDEKMVLRYWLGRYLETEEYCKDNFSKIKLYLISDILFYYALFLSSSLQMK